MPLIAFDDAVTAANLPAQQYGVFYLDGLYANETQVRARLPRAHLFGITVTGRTGQLAAFCDCERGDLTPEQAEEWVVKQITLGIGLVGVYASLDTWHDGLWAALEKYGDRIKRWCAAYDQDPSLTLTYLGVTYRFDAHQWAGNVAPGDDRNVADPSFFTPWKAPTKPAPKPVADNDPPKPKPKPKRKSLPLWRLAQIKDRVWRPTIRKIKKTIGTPFGGFRP